MLTKPALQRQFRVELILQKLFEHFLHLPEGHALGGAARQDMIPTEQETEISPVRSVQALNRLEHVRGKDLLAEREDAPIGRIYSIIPISLLNMSE